MGARRLWALCACVLLVGSGNAAGAGEWETSGDGPSTTPVATTVTNDWEISGDDSPTTPVATTAPEGTPTPTNDWEISGDDSPTTTPTTTPTLPTVWTGATPVSTTPIDPLTTPMSTTPTDPMTTPMSTTPTPPKPPKTTPTPPTSSPTGATTATASTSPCFNGGTWQGGQCLCPPNFQGDRCQNAKDAVEVENVNVTATVEMTTKIDANFSEELNDKSSEEYRNFTGEFRRVMSQVYRDIKGYKDVEVRKLSNGSIVVDYDVLLVVSASAVANETAKNISESLVTAVQNYTGTNCSLCFVTNSTKVQNVTVQEVEEDVCHAQIQENFRDFYVPYLTAAGVVCITRCDARHAERWSCGYGSCSVGERGPRCQCSDEAAFWYRDRFCRSRVSKVAVTAGASVAALVLVTAVFTALLLLNRRRQKERDRNRMRSRSELYDSDDGDWDRPQGFAMHNLAATWEDMETPGTSYINLERVDTSRTIHFRRPTVVP